MQVKLVQNLCAHQGSNLGPHEYQSCALPAELYAQCRWKYSKNLCKKKTLRQYLNCAERVNHSTRGEPPLPALTRLAEQDHRHRHPTTGGRTFLVAPPSHALLAHVGGTEVVAIGRGIPLPLLPPPDKPRHPEEANCPYNQESGQENPESLLGFSHGVGRGLVHHGASPRDELIFFEFILVFEPYIEPHPKDQNHEHRESDAR